MFEPTYIMCFYGSFSCIFRGVSSSNVIYACSGCSSSGQMTHWLALQIDQAGLAEMSCIAGLGGDVPSLVRKAKSAESIIAIDGCPLHCALACINKQGLSCDLHYDLSDMGVKKTKQIGFLESDAQRILQSVLLDLNEIQPQPLVVNSYWRHLHNLWSDFRILKRHTFHFVCVKSSHIYHFDKAGKNCRIKIASSERVCTGWTIAYWY